MVVSQRSIETPSPKAPSEPCERFLTGGSVCRAGECYLLARRLSPEGRRSLLYTLRMFYRAEVPSAGFRRERDTSSCQRTVRGIVQPATLAIYPVSPQEQGSGGYLLRRSSRIAGLQQHLVCIARRPLPVPAGPRQGLSRAW